MSMILNGTNHAELSYPASIPGMQDVTLFFMVSLDDPAIDQYVGGMNDTGGSYRMLSLRTTAADSKLQARHRLNDSSDSHSAVHHSVALADTVYRVALRWVQATGILTLNVDDNVKVVTDTADNQSSYPTEKFSVGCCYDDSGVEQQFLSGKIQYATQWTGVALSDAELADIMDGSVKPKDSPTTPDYSYPLISDANSDIGGTALTLVNNPTFDSVDMWNAGATTTETLDNVTLEPAAGKQYVTIGATPDLTYKSLLYGTDPAAVTGDQLESDTVTSDGKAITLNDDGTFSIANVGTNVQTFNYRVYDIDGSGWSAMATATVTPQAGEPDTTKPNIEIIGSSTVFVDIGGTFTDQGALVTDNVDADTTIYSNVTVTTATANTFTLPYDYTDGAGNVGDTAYRTVVVRDPDEVTGSKAILRSIWSPII